MMVSLTESERPWSVETVETGANRLDNGKYNCTLIRNRENWGAKYPHSSGATTSMRVAMAAGTFRRSMR